MIVDKIENYLTSSDLTIDDELISQMWDSFEFATKRQFMENRELSRNLRGSNPGPCARKMAYAHLGYKEGKGFEARTKITFWLGDIIELATIGLIKLAEVEIKDTCLEPEGQAEGLFEAAPGLYIPCHADGIIPAQSGITPEDLLLEVKSSSDFGFKRQWKQGKVSDNYILQHQVYLEAFNLDKGLFVVINKNTGHLHEIKTYRDPDYVEWAKKNYVWASEADANNLPPRFVDGENYGRRLKSGKPTEILAWGCSYCSFAHHCWPGLQIDLSGYKPVYSVDPNIEDNIDEVGIFGQSLDEEFELNLGL